MIAGGGVNVEVGQDLHPLDEDVEDAKVGIGPERLGLEQGCFVDAGGTVERVVKGAGAFVLVERIVVGADVGDDVGDVAVGAADAAERAEAVSLVGEPSVTVAVGEVTGIAGADALRVVSRHVEESDVD